MNDHKTASRITLAFNVALFIFSAALGVFRFRLSVSDMATGVTIEGLVMITAVDMVRFIVVLFITAYFVREFWNRLAAKVFDVRAVTTQETIAFILILSILGA